MRVAFVVLVDMRFGAVNRPQNIGVVVAVVVFVAGRGVEGPVFPLVDVPAEDGVEFSRRALVPLVRVQGLGGFGVDTLDLAGLLIYIGAVAEVRAVDRAGGFLHQHTQRGAGVAGADLFGLLTAERSFDVKMQTWGKIYVELGREAQALVARVAQDTLFAEPPPEM